MKGTRLVWLPLAGFLAFVALVLLFLRAPPSTAVPSRMVGAPLPSFALPPALPGRPGLAAGDFTGRVRLLNIFASWCIPCAAEGPALTELAGQGVEIDGAAVRDHPGDLAAFLAKNGDPYTRIGADDIGRLQLAIGSSGVPETYVIDGRGVIRYQHIGDIRAEEVPMILDRLSEAGWR